MNRDDHERLFNLSLDMMCVAGYDGYFKVLNPAWERTLGWKPAELMAKPFLDFVHPDDRAKTSTEAGAIAESGRYAVAFENRYLCRDGSYKWLLWNSTPFPEERLIYAVAREITDRKKAEQLKNEVIGLTSHELRTPLTAIQLSLEMLRSGEFGALPPESRRLVDVSLRNSGRMLRMITDYLDIEKIESGKMEFKLKPLLLLPLIEDTVRDTQSYADRFAVRYVVRRPMPEAEIMADSDRIVQVMANLLSNAAKFSPTGDVVEVAAEREDGFVRVSVSDHGPGIPEEFRGKVFQKFSQAPIKSDRKGTGLGLSISKAIVERLGGRIGFDTGARKGTTFFVELPLRACAGASKC